jgi:hypothetical protein
MKTIYDYLYYRCYDLLGSIGKYNLVWVSINLLSMMEMLVFITLMAPILHADQQLLSNHPILYYLYGFVFLVFLAFNSYMFLYKNRYIDVVNRFEKEPNMRQRIYRIISLFLIITLVIVSVMVL